LAWGLPPRNLLDGGRGIDLNRDLLGEGVKRIPKIKELADQMKESKRLFESLFSEGFTFYGIVKIAKEPVVTRPKKDGPRSYKAVQALRCDKMLSCEEADRRIREMDRIRMERNSGRP